MKAKRKRDGKKPTSIGATASENSDTMPPLFAFDKMQEGTGYSVNCCDAANRGAALSKLFELSRLTWNQIKHSHRHGAGAEKIARAAIKASIPSTIKDDVTFLALRYNGKAPMVGYRDGRTFYILYLDHNFSLYNHG